MKRKFLFLAGAALAAAVVLTLTLGGFGRSSKVSADPASFDFDIILCDGVGGANDPSCTDPATAADNGAALGMIQPGDNPEVKTNLTMDTTPVTADEAFCDLADAVWQGITPTAGAAIIDGDEVGEITRSIESNLVSPLTNSVSGLTGQPPICATGASALADTFNVYDAELDGSQTVSHQDTDDDGLLACRSSSRGEAGPWSCLKS